MGRLARLFNLESPDTKAIRLLGERLNDDIRSLSAEYADTITKEEGLTDKLETLWWETYNALEDEWIAMKDQANTPNEHLAVRRISNEKKRERITKERLSANPAYQNLLCEQRRLRRHAIETGIKIDHKTRQFVLLLRT